MPAVVNVESYILTMASKPVDLDPHRRGLMLDIKKSSGGYLMYHKKTYLHNALVAAGRLGDNGARQTQCCTQMGLTEVRGVRPV